MELSWDIVALQVAWNAVPQTRYLQSVLYIEVVIIWHTQKRLIPSSETAFGIANNINQIEESSVEKPTLGSLNFSIHLRIWKTGFISEAFV